MQNNSVLTMRNITKEFVKGVKALDDVKFDLRKGEIHALLGENGAGKSTLLNILTGAIHMDAGEIILNGRKIDIRTPIAAKREGIIKVHQELQLIPELSVAKNLFLGFEPQNKFSHIIKFNEMHKKAEAVLIELDADFSSRDVIKNLSTAQMQLVEIGRALLQNFSVIALDEPTSSLTDREIKKLFEILGRLKKQGKAIIYVSHRLNEVFEICDRATIYRDGKYICKSNVKDTNRKELIKHMTGRDLSNIFKNDNKFDKNKTALSVRNLNSIDNKFKNISFDLYKGEILGIAGLVGAGRTEVVRGIFGADELKNGEIYIDDKKVNIKSPKDAIKKGIILVPEDRKLHGMIGILSNMSNICISSLDRYLKYNLLSKDKMRQNAKFYAEKMKLSPPNVDSSTNSLSGGNQQKVVLSRCLSTKARILILDEPTRGIDIGAKADIYTLMNQLASEGISIIMISSELPEIIGMSNRILVMGEGVMKGEVLPSDFSEENIMHLAMGGE